MKSLLLVALLGGSTSVAAVLLLRQLDHRVGAAADARAAPTPAHKPPADHPPTPAPTPERDAGWAVVDDEVRPASASPRPPKGNKPDTTDRVSDIRVKELGRFPAAVVVSIKGMLAHAAGTGRKSVLLYALDPSGGKVGAVRVAVDARDGGSSAFTTTCAMTAAQYGRVRGWAVKDVGVASPVACMASDLRLVTAEATRRGEGGPGRVRFDLAAVVENPTRAAYGPPHRLALQAVDGEGFALGTCDPSRLEDLGGGSFRFDGGRPIAIPAGARARVELGDKQIESALYARIASWQVVPAQQSQPHRQLGD